MFLHGYFPTLRKIAVMRLTPCVFKANSEFRISSSRRFRKCNFDYFVERQYIVINNHWICVHNYRVMFFRCLATVEMLILGEANIGIIDTNKFILFIAFDFPVEH